MMQHEFEHLALRGDAHISSTLYDQIERFYASDNEYHESHGGIYETKQEFVKRVFGGKINTPKTIMEKIAAESIRENRYALRGTSVSREELERMDDLIRDHYRTIALMI